MTDTSLGFRFRYTLSGNPPVIGTYTIKDTETLTEGDLVNLESGEIDLAATGDTALVGMVKETAAGTDSTTQYKVIMNPDAVYGVYDATARVAGATLDIAGATGAMTIAASSNTDVIVVADSAANEETLVQIIEGSHYLN